MLKGLMQDSPLTLDRVVRRMETVTGNSVLSVATDKGLERISYRHLAANIRRLVAAFHAYGLGSGDRVASLGFNTREHLELFLGVPVAGGVLHTVNPRLSDEHLEYVLTHGGARMVFIDASLFEKLVPLLLRVTNIERIVILEGNSSDPSSYESFLAEAPFVLPQMPPLDEYQASGLCYTSGTTGLPKGVLYSHRSTFLHALSTCLADVQAISSRHVILPIVPLFHANGWGLPQAAGLTGASLALPGTDVSGPSIAKLIQSEGVTFASGVPTVLNDLLHFADAHPGILDSLGVIVSGGAPLTLPLVEGFARHDVEVVQGWGMTETSPNVSMSHPPRHVKAIAEANDYRLAAGRLNPLVDARIVDTAGQELPWDGESSGEIQLRSPHAASGYYLDPEATAEKMDNGWLRTGDLATIDDNGYVRLKDRLKDLIKTGGEWIPTVELEQHILSSPLVSDVAVVARSDDRWGERPFAYIVPVAGTPFAEASIRSYLATRIPKWWIPDSFLEVECLPLTTIGKVDKKALRDRANG